MSNLKCPFRSTNAILFKPNLKRRRFITPNVTVCYGSGAAGPVLSLRAVGLVDGTILDIVPSIASKEPPFFKELEQ